MNWCIHLLLWTLRVVLTWMSTTVRRISKEKELGFDPKWITKGNLKSKTENDIVQNDLSGHPNCVVSVQALLIISRLSPVQSLFLQTLQFSNVNLEYVFEEFYSKLKLTKSCWKLWIDLDEDKSKLFHRYINYSASNCL